MAIGGIDLSGPGSPHRTVVALCRSRRDRLDIRSVTFGATDPEILALAPHTACIVGIDSHCPTLQPAGVAPTTSALAAWHWVRGTTVWLHEADPPLHPYDFAC